MSLSPFEKGKLKIAAHVREELDRASAQARERGVLDVPTVRVGNELFAGEAALRRAVAAAAA